MLKQRILKTMCIASVITALPLASAFASTGKINGNAVRLRQEASTDSKIITLLEKGKLKNGGLNH